MIEDLVDSFFDSETKQTSNYFDNEVKASMLPFENCAVLISDQMVKW